MPYFLMHFRSLLLRSNLSEHKSDKTALITIIIIIGAAVLLVVIFMIIRLGRKRMLRKWAVSRGYSFVRKGNSDFNEKISGFSIVPKSKRHSAVNIIKGEYKDLRFHAFDFASVIPQAYLEKQYEEVEESFSGCVFDIGRDAGKIIIEPKELLGILRLDSDECPAVEGEFPVLGNDYIIRSKDAGEAREILSPGLQSYIAGSPPYLIEITGNCVLAHRLDLFSRSEFEDALEFLSGFIGSM